jgi:hypothetical protein
METSLVVIATYFRPLLSGSMQAVCTASLGDSTVDVELDTHGDVIGYNIDGVFRNSDFYYSESSEWAEELWSDKERHIVSLIWEENNRRKAAKERTAY